MITFCLEQDADLHMAQLMPLPLTVSCFSKILSGFTFLVLAHLSSPGQKAIKHVCVITMINIDTVIIKKPRPTRTSITNMIEIKQHIKYCICECLLRNVVLSWTCPNMKAYAGMHSVLSDLGRQRVWSLLELSQRSMCTD